MGSIQGKISPSTGKSWVHRSKCCPSFLSAFVVRRATECSLGSLVQAARAAVCPSSLPNHASGLPSLAHLLERMSSDIDVTVLRFFVFGKETCSVSLGFVQFASRNVDIGNCMVSVVTFQFAREYYRTAHFEKSSSGGGLRLLASALPWLTGRVGLSWLSLR